MLLLSPYERSKAHAGSLFLAGGIILCLFVSVTCYGLNDERCREKGRLSSSAGDVSHGWNDEERLDKEPEENNEEEEEEEEGGDVESGVKGGSINKDDGDVVDTVGRLKRRMMAQVNDPSPQTSDESSDDDSSSDTSVSSAGSADVPGLSSKERRKKVRKRKQKKTKRLSEHRISKAGREVKAFLGRAALGTFAPCVVENLGLLAVDDLVEESANDYVRGLEALSGADAATSSSFYPPPTEDVVAHTLVAAYGMTALELERFRSLVARTRAASSVASAAKDALLGSPGASFGGLLASPTGSSAGSRRGSAARSPSNQSNASRAGSTRGSPHQSPHQSPYHSPHLSPRQSPRQSRGNSLRLSGSGQGDDVEQTATPPRPPLHFDLEAPTGHNDNNDGSDDGEEEEEGEKAAESGESDDDNYHEDDEEANEFIEHEDHRQHPETPTLRQMNNGGGQRGSLTGTGITTAMSSLTSSAMGMLTFGGSLSRGHEENKKTEHVTAEAATAAAGVQNGQGFVGKSATLPTLPAGGSKRRPPSRPLSGAATPSRASNHRTSQTKKKKKLAVRPTNLCMLIFMLYYFYFSMPPTILTAWVCLLLLPSSCTG